MNWMHDVKCEAYEQQLLTTLLKFCHTVKCAIREEEEHYFEAIQDE